MEDYKEEIKTLFLRYYSPIGDDTQKKFLSTTDILEMVRGVIPRKPIGEHDIYEVMKDMGFKQELETLYDEICIYEGDEEEGISPEYDKIEIGRVFQWVVYKLD